MPPDGLEPPANGLGNRCSIHLSYGGCSAPFKHIQGLQPAQFHNLTSATVLARAHMDPRERARLRVRVNGNCRGDTIRGGILRHRLAGTPHHQREELQVNRERFQFVVLRSAVKLPVALSPSQVPRIRTDSATPEPLQTMWEALWISITTPRSYTKAVAELTAIG